MYVPSSVALARGDGGGGGSADCAESKGMGRETHSGRIVVSECWKMRVSDCGGWSGG